MAGRPEAIGQGAAAFSEPGEWDDRPVHGFEDLETRLEPRPEDEYGPTPSFMRSPRKAEPMAAGQRRLWAGAAAFLAVLLILQLGLAGRERLAAAWPAVAPVLSALCAPLGCRIEPPRQIAALVVEGSNLRQLPAEQGYELLVALRNRASFTVRMPSFELTLTDGQGHALLRKVLSAQQLGTSANAIDAEGETSLRAKLIVSDRRIAGYTVEIFYP
jgi:hypothetical protein